MKILILITRKVTAASLANTSFVYFLLLLPLRHVEHFSLTFGWVLIQLSEHRRETRSVHQGGLREHFVSTQAIVLSLRSNISSIPPNTVDCQLKNKPVTVVLLCSLLFLSRFLTKRNFGSQSPRVTYVITLAIIWSLCTFSHCSRKTHEASGCLSRCRD